MKPDPGDLGTTVLAILGKQVLLLITCLFFYLWDSVVS